VSRRHLSGRESSRFPATLVVEGGETINVTLATRQVVRSSTRAMSLRSPSQK
jgi:hypothetical protein